MTEITKTKAVGKTSGAAATKAAAVKPASSKPVKLGAPKPVLVKAASPKVEAPKAAAPKAKPTIGKPKATGVKANNAKGATLIELSPEAVAAKAYEIFISEGHQHGSDQDHWFRAESELRGKSD